MDMWKDRTMRYSDIPLFVMQEILIRTKLETRAKVGLKNSADMERGQTQYRQRGQLIVYLTNPVSGSTRVIFPRRQLPRFCRFCFDRRQQSECPWSNVVMQLARFVRLGHPIPCQFLIEKPLILRDERGVCCVKCPRRTDIIIKWRTLLAVADSLLLWTVWKP